jgi:hypothetical protein
MVDPEDRTKKHQYVSGCPALLHHSNNTEVLSKIKARLERNKDFYLHFEISNLCSKLEAMPFM